MRKITNLKIMLKEFFQFYEVISMVNEECLSICMELWHMIMRLHTAPERLVNPIHSSETLLLLLQPVLAEDAQALASPGKIVVILYQLNNN